MEREGGVRHARELLLILMKLGILLGCFIVVFASQYIRHRLHVGVSM